MTLSAKLRTAVFVLLALASVQRGAVAQSNANFESLAGEASAAREQNNIPLAIKLYARAVAVNPKWPSGWLNLGVLQYQTGAYAAARDALTRFIGMTPQPGPALGLRGLCEFEVGEYARSLADIRRSLSSGVQEQPRQEELLRFHEAMSLTKLGEFTEALRTYAFFAQKQVSTPEILIGIGLAGLRMPLLPKEAGAQRESLELAGSAGFDLMAGNQQPATEKFDDLFQRFPDLINAHAFYGLLLFVSDPDAAFYEFKREVELHPANEQGQLMEAWSLLLRRDPETALPHAIKAERTRPSSAAAQLVLGRALVETGEVENGMEHLQRALAIEPKNLEVHIALAEAYSKAGNRAEAQRERKLCLDMTHDGVNRVALP